MGGELAAGTSSDLAGVICGILPFAAAFLLSRLVVGLRAKAPGRFVLGSLAFKSLEALVQHVARSTKLPSERAPGSYEKLEDVTFAGRLETGRRARVLYFAEEGDARRMRVRFSVDANDAPQLKVTEETIVTKIEKVLGQVREIEVGDRPFDARFLLQTGSTRAATRALHTEMRQAISDLFDRGIAELVFDGERLRATADAGALNPAAYDWILRTLDWAARSVDRKKINVRVLGGDRQALVDESGRTRCPFCRENISGDEEDLLACERCSTVVHQACWEEHGGCPLLGCTGRSERARTR